MKKKLFGFIIAIAFVLTGGLCLTACGEEPSLRGIGAFYNNQEYNTGNSYYLGSFEKGSQVNLDYKVIAYYSDNSQKELEKTQYTCAYSFDGSPIAELPQKFEIGNYEIKINYENFEMTLIFTIERASRQYQLQVVGNTTIHFGQAQPTVSVRDGEDLRENSVNFYTVPTSLFENGNVPTEEEIVDAQESYFPENNLSVGSYRLYATVDEQEEFKAGKTNYVTLTVLPGEWVFVNSEDQLESFTFQYSGQVGDVNINDILTNHYVTLKNKYNDQIQETFNVSIVSDGENDVVNYSSYKDGVDRQLQAEFLDGVEANYLPVIWNCKIYVEKGQIERPTLVSDSGNGEVRLGGELPIRWSLINVVRKSDGQRIELNDHSIQIVIETVSEPGEHSYTLSLVDNDNYEWAGEGTETFDVTYTKHESTSV